MFLRTLQRTWAIRCEPLNHYRQARFLSTKQSDPLRILFCGSDHFSSKSLKAVYQLQADCPDLIGSVDVVCRPPKRSGRGLKTTREVPISVLAKTLALPLHYVDTFRGWQLPRPAHGKNSEDAGFNLILAVSFGLLIPQRLLSAAKYGGLNVHPSMLPDFRGAAPVEHALLARSPHTGVTLQTLHPTRMDHGHILLQTPQPGIPIQGDTTTTLAELKEELATVGAAMLTQGLRERLYVPPVKDLTPTLDEVVARQLRSAPKITSEDRHVRWQQWTSDEIILRSRVLGNLWSNANVPQGTTRITFSDGFEQVNGTTHAENLEPGTAVADADAVERTALHFKTVDGKVLCAREITVPGYGTKTAADIARKLKIIHPVNALVSRAEYSLR